MTKFVIEWHAPGTAYGKINTTLWPDSFLKSSFILKIFALALRARAKILSMTSDSKKLFTGNGWYYILPYAEISLYSYHVALGNAFGTLGCKVEGIWQTISALGPKSFTKRTQMMGTSFKKMLTSL